MNPDHEPLFDEYGDLRVGWPRRWWERQPRWLVALVPVALIVTLGAVMAWVS